MTSTLALLGFEWLRPELGPALVAAPLVGLLGLASLAARRRARARIVDPELEPRLYRDFAPARARSRVLLAAAGLFFGALALIGPVRGFSLREVERRGLDLVVCIDTSRSMLVADLSRETRLEHAKREVGLLLDRLRGDRVALVAFSGDVRDVTPLTRDRNTLRWFLKALSPLDNRRGGTDLGLALEHGLELFDGRTGAHEAIVLLTDGEDLEGRAVAVAEEAQRRNIRIFVVGMGTEGGGKIPDERRGGFVKDNTGADVVSRLDDSTLRQIAAATGGAYASAETPLALEKLYDRYIATMEGRTLSQGKERIPHDRYQWPLVIAFALMLAESSLRERRAPRPGTGRTT